MPQWTTYPVTTTVNLTDTFLINQSGVLKQVSFGDLVSAITAEQNGALPTTIINADTVLSSDGRGQVVVNGGGPVSVTLPLANGNAGIGFWVVNKGAGAVTMQPSGSDTIGGNLTVTLSQYQNGIFVSDSSNLWTRFGG